MPSTCWSALASCRSSQSSRRAENFLEEITIPSISADCTGTSWTSCGCLFSLCCISSRGQDERTYCSGRNISRRVGRIAHTAHRDRCTGLCASRTAAHCRFGRNCFCESDPDRPFLHACEVQGPDGSDLRLRRPVLARDHVLSFARRLRHTKLATPPNAVDGRRAVGIDCRPLPLCCMDHGGI